MNLAFSFVAASVAGFVVSHRVGLLALFDLPTSMRDICGNC